MNQPSANPDDKLVNEAGDEGRDECPAGEVEAAHDGSPDPEAVAEWLKAEVQADMPPLPSLEYIAAALAPSPAKTSGDPLPQLPPPLSAEPTPTAKPADVRNLPISGLDALEDIPPPLPPEPEISFAGVEYERRVHSLPVIGYFHSVEPIVERPGSPEEAYRALSRVDDILARLYARMGDPGDMRGQIEFCIAGETANRDRLIDYLPDLSTPA